MNAKKLAQSREHALAKYKPVLAKHAELIAAANMPDAKESYAMVQKVGEGAYGEVFKARRKRNDELVAVKIIRVNCSVQADNGLSLDLIREIKFLTQLSKYQNFVTLQETFFSGGDIWMVFEYMEADLSGLLSTPVVLDVGHIKCIMQQLLDALRVLHSKNIMHRDIKASNLLVGRGGIVKLADFGLATNFKTRDRFGCNVVTLWYRAPELLLLSERYGPAVDIWSAGVIFGELVTRDHLFPGQQEADQIRLIFETCGVPTEVEWPGVMGLAGWNSRWVPGTRGSTLDARMNGRLPEDGLTLLKQTLSMNPIHRPTAKQALAHPFFSSPPYCTPAQLPAFQPYHEWEVRKQRQRAREEAKRASNSTNGASVGNSTNAVDGKSLDEMMDAQRALLGSIIKGGEAKRMKTKE
eukprot:TRINITY_DN5850_c0_g1_i1.p2 TRINITY_DN5850_c0_g1~~TRINITY_DN5850_c0_g1_i1.p2  ORF type:complete len:410 (-),score=142.00 TRINITY_DN5850_c0_g1_i1:5-1234(-)